MSQFCGKCDIYDTFGDATDEFLQKSSFYIRGADGRKHHLEIKNQKDLAKYYPYLTGCYSYSKDKGAHVEICSESFIDSEEKEFIGWLKRDLVKYYKKCKRNKTTYDAYEALENNVWFHKGKDDFADWEIELAKRVNEHGEKADIEGLHRPMHDYFRNEWYEELRRLGYSEYEAYNWVYGWKRWMEKMKNDKKEESKTEEEGTSEE